MGKIKKGYRFNKISPVSGNPLKAKTWEVVDDNLYARVRIVSCKDFKVQDSTIYYLSTKYIS